MKILGLVLGIVTIMTAFAPSGTAPGADEKNTSTVCLTYVNAGLGCATGKIDSLPPTNCNDGCDVTLTADLFVTPVACGWLEQGGLLECAYTTPATRPTWRDTQHFTPGTYTVKSELCVTDPTVTYTFPCDELSHAFVVPETNVGTQAILTQLTRVVEDIVDDLPVNGPRGSGKLVYASETFRVYQTSGEV